jgi:acylphosphatase
VAPDRAAFRFVVRGRVQGVGFRRSAQQEALRLGLTGWVRNTPAGDVEGTAEGDPAALEAFASWLAIGPRLAGVAGLTREPANPAGARRFEVR